MAEVVVSVQNCGITVLEQTVSVEPETVLGDVRGATVRYAGSTLRLTAQAGRVLVGSVPLVLGQPRVVQERPVRVTLELIVADAVNRSPWPAFDPRMLVASGALVLFAWWLQTLGTVATASPTPPVQHVAAPGIYIK